MMRRGGLALALAAGLAIFTAAPSPQTAMAAPEALSVVATWELSFKFNAPERLVLEDNGQKKVFWFVRYTVTNNTGRDILFTPDFKVMTDTGQALTAVNDAAAFAKINALYRNPLLESPAAVLGRLRQGDDNAKDSVAIFTGIDADARVMRFFVSGLTGDTQNVKNPLTGEDVVLYKTLVLKYEIPGDAIGIDPHPQFKGKQWVLR